MPHEDDSTVQIPPKRKPTIQLFAENQKGLAIGALSVFLLVALGIALALSVTGHEVESLSVIIGISAMMLIVLSEKQGVTVFFAIVILGTLVAREEFLLEVAAMARGEKIAAVRDARNFISPEGQIRRARKTDDRLVKKFEELLADRGTKTDESILSEVRAFKKRIDIELDAAGLSQVSLATVKKMATDGQIYLEEEKEEMKSLDISHTVGLEELRKQLIAPGYAKQDTDTKGKYLILTPKGLELAQELGLEPVPQVITTRPKNDPGGES